MASFSEYQYFDAIGLSQLIANGEITKKEILIAAFERIETLNPDLNAIVNVLEEYAYDQLSMQMSSQKNNPKFLDMSGVPIAVKDCVAGIKGIPQKFGTRLTKSFVPDRDEEIIRRYREAGLVFVGQTNVPEFSSSITTESVLYGVCRNPWNLNKTVGGSSGGSACAVASGMVPVATANDSAGSIRIPASCTGVFGFKPSRGRTPNGPDVSEIWNGLFVQHVLTRSVRDSAAFLDIAAGLDAGAPYDAPSFGGSYLEQSVSDVEPLKIAFSLEAMGGIPVENSCKEIVIKTARLLEDLGHEVVEEKPEFNTDGFFQIIENLLAVNLAFEMQNYAEFQGVELTSETIEACHLEMVQIGKSLPASVMMEFFALKAACERGMGRFFNKYDVYLTPTLAKEPVDNGFIHANSSDRRQYLDRFWGFSPYTILANITGVPSMSVPLFMGGSGLPIGSMFSAAYGQDDKLFRLAGQLEKACPWRNNNPSIF